MAATAGPEGGLSVLVMSAVRCHLFGQYLRGLAYIQHRICLDQHLATNLFLRRKNLELKKGGRENCILCVADLLPWFSHSLHNKTNEKTKQTTS